MQMMLDIQEDYGNWIHVKKTDLSCRLLADRHYSRQTIGHPQFTRPGRNLVLRTPMGDAVWVTWSGIRDDGYDAWECAIFRNESGHKSSELIKQAVEFTYREWGEPPKDGIITYVKPDKIKSSNPGYCFKLAGFQKIKTNSRGLVILQMQRGRA